MKKTIKILPINIPGKEIPLILEAMEQDLFYLKVKKKVAEYLKDYNQDEFVFYSKSKNLVVHEDDRVSKLFLSKEYDEIELYLSSDLIKKVIQGGQGNKQIIEQKINKEDKLENEIKELKLVIQKLQNDVQQEQSKFINQIKNNNEQENQLKNEQKYMKERFEIQLKQVEEQRDEITKKYKEIIIVNTELKNEIMQQEKQIEELNYHQKIFEAEKKFNEEQQNKDRKERFQPKNSNDNQINEIKLEFEKFKILYQDEKLERKKDAEKILQLESKQEELRKTQQKEIEKMQQARGQTEFEKGNLKEELKRSGEKCCQYKEKIIELEKDIIDLTNNIALIKQQLCKLEEELKSRNIQINSLNANLEEKNQEIERKNLNINNILNSKDEQSSIIKNLEQEILKLEDELQIKQNSCRKLNQENQQKSDKISLLENQLQDEINLKSENIDSAKEQIKKLSDNIEKEKNKLQIEENKRAQLIKRIKLNQLRKVREGKIISPTEAVFRNMQNPFQFVKGENIMTKDYSAKVEIIMVDKNKAIQSLTESQDFDINKLVTRQSIGNWQIKQSIGINGDGTKRKGYLMQVMNSEGNLYDRQVFLIKKLDGFETIVTVDQALYIAQNSLIAKVLAEYFQDKIQQATIKPPCKFVYNEPFLLNINENFYIAEKLIEGTFFKFNGDGHSKIEDQNLKSYFYAFSIFTYQVTKKMLMVSNIQGNFNGSEFILCDPIISSPEGIMGDEDLTEQHILNFYNNYKINPKECGKDYLTNLGFVLLL